ncbi:MFS transporter [Paenarthrobacter sp. NPDC058040]|uniref:MFS transporter n=1 Tax=unclassified Paenarthrobacter TaxID=2634190 RepID=UPI0036D75CEF
MTPLSRPIVFLVLHTVQRRDEVGVTAPPKASLGTQTAVRGAVGFLIIMEFGSGILQGWYPVLLKAIGLEFKVGSAELNWVNTAYLLATVLCVPVIAKLGDRFGHKRLLLISTAMVAAGSVLVAMAPSFAIFLVGRALQAPLAAFLPLEFAIVRERDEENAGKSIGKLVGALTFGGAIGSFGAGLLFGVIGDLRTVLWVPAIFLIICVPVVAFLVPETKVRAAGRIDWLGASLLGAGLLSLLSGVANGPSWGWTSTITWASIVAGVVLLAAWWFVEKLVKHPLINVNLLTKGGLGLPILIGFLFGAQLFGSNTASSVYVLTNPNETGFGLGFTPSNVGLLALAVAGATFVATTQGHRTMKWLGVKGAIALGGALTTIGFVVFIVAPLSVPIMVAAKVVGGLGNGVIVAVLPTIVVKRAPRDSVGIASAMYNTTRTAAGAIAGAVFALVMASFLLPAGAGGSTVATTSLQGYIVVWVICAVLSAAVVAMTFFLRPVPETEPTVNPVAEKEAA